MFVGRETELKFLNNYYAKEGSQILVVYGQRGVGKSTLLKCFAEKKKSAFYTARACSAREQLYQWGNELREQGKLVAEYPTYEDIFSCILENQTAEKQILVVEEFHHIIKGDDAFMTELIMFLEKRKLSHQVMVVLCTSASGWVENSMITRIGSRAAALGGLLKVREVKYTDMCKIFPGYSSEDSMYIYTVLGGIPGLWTSFDENLTAKENVIRNILRKDSRLYEEMAVYIAEELREPAVYYTILAAMARGCNKLNDIYHHTGFSRAKISVYLKNLMELEMVEKVFAGTYRISNTYVRFYFRFLFPHKSMLNSITPVQFYDRYIAGAYDTFAEESYRLICKDLLTKKYGFAEEWTCKNGKIYLCAKDNAGGTYVAACSYAGMYTEEDYELLMHSMKKAKINADTIILFGERGCEAVLKNKLQEKGVLLHSVQ